MRTFAIAAAGGAVVFGAVAFEGVGPAAAQDVTQLRWATSAVGSAGHRALVSLATVLNREVPEYAITVLPTPGAAATLRGFAGEQFDGYYGADVAFHEIADGAGRFQDFQPPEDRELLQSFWTYTLELGLGVRGNERDQYQGWRDLSGEPVFTGPAPWDVRAALERAMDILDIGHEYVELDTGLAGSSLAEGTIDAFIVYTTGETSPAPWVTEALLSTDVAILNPSDEEISILEDAGITLARVDGAAFDAEVHVDTAVLVPFYYGFHVGMNVPEDDVYRMLVAIEENAGELAESDPGLSQIREDMVGMQVRGIESTGDAARIHPGLARYLREKGAWDDAWDSRVAQ